MIRTRHFSCYIEGSDEEINSIMRAISALQNVYNMSYWNAVAHLFRLGAQVAMQDAKNENDRDEIRRGLIKHRLLQSIRRESQEDQEIRKGMTELGIERIVQTAKRDGLDEAEVRNVLDKIKTEMPYKDMAAQWLDSYCSDYRPHKTEDVRADAIKDGMLPSENDPSFESKWSMMRSVAGRMGLSGNGKWGEWQKKLL